MALLLASRPFSVCPEPAEMDHRNAKIFANETVQCGLVRTGQGRSGLLRVQNQASSASSGGGMRLVLDRVRFVFPVRSDPAILASFRREQRLALGQISCLSLPTFSLISYPSSLDEISTSGNLRSLAARVPGNGAL